MFQVRQDQDKGGSTKSARAWGSRRVGDREEFEGGRERAVGRLVVVQGQADLLEVVGAGLRSAASRTFWTAGSSKPIRIAMIAMTTSSSIRVKPCAGRTQC